MEKAGGADADRFSALPPIVLINEKNIGSIEDEAIQMVNRTLSALEEAIAAWESSPEKPAELKERYKSYLMMRDELTKWARRFLLSRNEERAFKGRLELLRELCDICQVFTGLV